MKRGPQVGDDDVVQTTIVRLDRCKQRVASVSPEFSALVRMGSSSRACDGDLIRATLQRQKTHRERVFSQDLPFSWLRLFVGAASVLFVLTDVPRSGLGVDDLRKYYPAMEPDVTMSSSTPWAYPVFRASREEAANASVRLWSYKFDTTSVVWRAFAQHLSVAEFPDCVLYRMPCPSTKLSGIVVFDFVDALVNAVAQRLQAPSTSTVGRKRKFPRKLMLRTESDYTDRVHDFLAPNVFNTRMWRTSEAVHFPESVLARLDAKDICFGPARPFFCQQIWINFERSCPRSASSCRQVGHVYTHTIQRLQDVRGRFPNASVDLVFLTSVEDLQMSRFSLSVEGNQRADVSAIIRARMCNEESKCETVYVDDYRYEIDILVSGVVQWYRFLVALRLSGQTYFYLRALGLVASCYYALGPRLSSNDETIKKRWRKAMHLLSKAPTQCIVFGSPFPIMCYTAAHLIDASTMYRILEKRFISQNGVFDLELTEFITVAVIQMRSVWVYAMLLHVTVKSVTWRRWSGWGDGVIGGILGVPEFLLTAMASVNTAAQFRSIRFRSTRVLSIQETMAVGSTSAIAILRQHSSNRSGAGKSHLGGVMIDLKFLACLLGVLVAVSILRATFLRIRARIRGHSGPDLDSLHWPLGRTPVPYSADILWPAVSLCVHWTSDFFCIREIDTKRMLTLRRLGQSAQISPIVVSRLMFAGRISRRRQTGVLHAAAPSVRMNDRLFRSIQHQMEGLYNRSDEVEGNVAFMNLVIMSDPFVYYQICMAGYSSVNLAYYQSLKHPDKVVLLPEEAASTSSEPMCHLRKLRQVYPRDLQWSELIQCG